MTAAALNLRRVAMRKIFRKRAAQRAAREATLARLRRNLEALDREVAGDGFAYLNRATGEYIFFPHPDPRLSVPRPPTPPRWWNKFLP
jgi:hypothetical protein